MQKPISLLALGKLANVHIDCTMKDCSHFIETRKEGLLPYGMISHAHITSMIRLPPPSPSAELTGVLELGVERSLSRYIDRSCSAHFFTD